MQGSSPGGASSQHRHLQLLLNGGYLPCPGAGQKRPAAPLALPWCQALALLHGLWRDRWRGRGRLRVYQSRLGGRGGLWGLDCRASASQGHQGNATQDNNVSWPTMYLILGFWCHYISHIISPCIYIYARMTIAPYQSIIHVTVAWCENGRTFQWTRGLGRLEGTASDVCVYALYIAMYYFIVIVCVDIDIVSHSYH